MAITFNAWQNTGGILRYDVTDAAYTDIGAAATVFDYFTNDCEAGDYLVFKFSTIQHARNQKFNIGTAFAATSVVFAWEYYKDDTDGWVAFDNLVDGTSNLTTIGVSEVTWDMPDKWINKNFGGALGYSTFWRIRIVSVNTPTEGGAQQTDTVKIGNNTLSIASEGSLSVPITWQNVVDADVAAGWGVFTKEGANHYRATRIGITIASDSFIKQENDVFEYYCCNNAEDHTFFESFYNNGYWKIGALDVDGYPYNGGKVVFYGGYHIYLCRGSSGKLYCYNSTLSSPSNLIPTHSFAGNTVEMYRVNLEYIEVLMNATNWTVRDVWHYKSLAFRIMTSPTSVVRWKGRGQSYPIYFYLNNAPDIEMEECDVEKILMYRRDVDSTMLNHKIVLDHADMTLQFNGVTDVTYTGKLYDKYTFDLKVTDGENAINNATVTITDNQGNTYNLTTDANGVITQQKFTRKHYAFIPNVSSGYNTTSYEYTLEIKKAGYTTYEADFTLEAKTDWTVALQGVLKRNPAMTGGMV